MVNKEYARKLRMSGLTYREVSEILGCSLTWSKVNLKGVPKSGESLSTEDINKIREDVLTTTNSLVYGVGVYVKGAYTARVDGEHTKEYMLWHGMLERCYSGNPKTPYTYDDCSVSDDFLNFQKFAAWCSTQAGFGLDKYQLDKDILVEGNKIYSAETCVFVPKDLNCFNRVNEGKYKQGVGWHEGTQKYRARIQDVTSGKRICLGLYHTEQDAFEAYVVAKNEQAQQWLKRLTGGEFVIDPRVITRLSSWTCPNYTPISFEDVKALMKKQGEQQ